MAGELRPSVGREDGFTLIELMIAIAIMTVIMGSMTYVMVNSLVDTAYSRQRGTAINLANQTIEELRARPWTTIRSGMNPATTPDATLAGDPNVVNGCFEDTPLDINGVIGPQSGCTPQQ